jgi:hypothetical protein
MDIGVFAFVALICLVAIFVTAIVRGEFQGNALQRREQKRQARNPPPRRRP